MTETLIEKLEALSPSHEDNDYYRQGIEDAIDIIRQDQADSSREEIAGFDDVPSAARLEKRDNNATENETSTGYGETASAAARCQRNAGQPPDVVERVAEAIRGYLAFQIKRHDAARAAIAAMPYGAVARDIDKTREEAERPAKEERVEVLSAPAHTDALMEEIAKECAARANKQNDNPWFAEAEEIAVSAARSALYKAFRAGATITKEEQVEVPLRPASNSILNRKAWQIAMDAYEAKFPDAQGVDYAGLQAGVRAYLAALPNKVPANPDYEAAMCEISEIVRVAGDNPDGLREFLMLNFRKEWGLTKMEHKSLLSGSAPKREPSARPAAEWHEDDGPALWWKFPIDEPPYAGTPLDDRFPVYKTHWTRIDVPTTKIEDGQP